MPLELHPVRHGVEAFINMKAEQAARKLPPSAGQTVDDLRQCGWLALCDAVGRFDPERGAFLTALSFALKTQFASLCGVRSTRRDALSLALSLDRPAFSDDLDGGLLLDSVDDSTAQNGYIEVEEAVYREELHAALERELCTLPTIDASLIRKRYWGGETLTSIAADAGFSVNRASQIHRDAIRKLRRPQHERALRQYIEESTD